MLRKIVISTTCSLILSTSLFALDVEATAKDVYTKAGGNKTESQWTRYFSKDKWLTKLGIKDLSDGDKATLLKYLNERSADKDQATVPK